MKIDSTRKISIVMPVFNSEVYLQRCIESILKQTYSNYELIIINDGSNDDSPKICDDYAKLDPRIKVFHKKNEGVSSARNLGIIRSSGRWVTFIDSDDWLENNALQIMVQIIEKEKVDCVRMSYFTNTDIEEKIIKHKIREGIYANEAIDELISALAVGKEQSYVYLLLIDRDLLLKTSLFNEDLHVMEDKCLYYEILLNANSFFISNTPTYHYFYNEKSVTRSPERRLENILQIVKSHQESIRILESRGRLSATLLTQLHTSHSFLTTSLLYSIFRDDNKPYIQLNKAMDIIRQNPEYAEMVKWSSTRGLPTNKATIIFIGHCVVDGRNNIVIKLFGLSLLEKKIIGILRGRHAH